MAQKEKETKKEREQEARRFFRNVQRADRCRKHYADDRTAEKEFVHVYE